MKTFIMIAFATLASFAAIAQKSKADTPNIKPSMVIVQYVCPMHPDIVSDKAGKCPKCNMDLVVSRKEQMKWKEIKTYTCPMHSEVVSGHKGICAKCSSELVADRRGSKQGVIVYSCSMHPGVASNKEGKCPICGMNLEKEKEISDNTRAKS